jgi:hypothetical protein
MHDIDEKSCKILVGRPDRRIKMDLKGIGCVEYGLDPSGIMMRASGGYLQTRGKVGNFLTR